MQKRKVIHREKMHLYSWSMSGTDGIRKHLRGIRWMWKRYEKKRSS